MPSSVQVGGQKLKLKANSRCTVTRSVTSTSVTRDWTASNGKDAKSKLDTFGPGESKVCSFFNGSGWSAIKYGETDLVVDEDGIGSVAGTKELPKGLQGWFKVGDSDGGWDDSPHGEQKKQDEKDIEEKQSETGGNKRHFSEGEEEIDDDSLYRSGIDDGDESGAEKETELTEQEKSQALAGLRQYIINSNADEMSETMYVPM